LFDNYQTNFKISISTIDSDNHGRPQKFFQGGGLAGRHVA